MIFNPAWSAIVSDLFINLSAGWLGAVLIVPNFSEEKGRRRALVLTADVLLATISLGIAFVLRRQL